jgi:tetratricopeptide (TPR) repeat protein
MEMDACMKCGETGKELRYGICADCSAGKKKSKLKRIVWIALGSIIAIFITLVVIGANVNSKEEYKANLKNADKNIASFKYGAAKKQLKAALDYKKTDASKEKYEMVVVLSKLQKDVDTESIQAIEDQITSDDSPSSNAMSDNFNVINSTITENVSNKTIQAEIVRYREHFIAGMIVFGDASYSKKGYMNALIGYTTALRFKNYPSIQPKVKISKSKVVSNFIYEAKNHIKDKEYQAAINTLRKAIAIDKNNASARTLLSSTLATKKRIDAQVARAKAREKARQAAIAREEASWTTDYDSGVKWKWSDHNSFSCTYSSSSCFQIKVKSDTGCPGGVYAEINLYDSSGAVIDYTNDTLSSLDAYQIGKMTFDTFNDSVSSGGVSKISCH